MQTLGILLTKYDQEQQYYEDMAKASKSLSYQLFLFRPTDINPINEQVHGLTYDHEKKQWCEEVFPLPSFIYDRCFYKNRTEFKANNAIIQWLKMKAEITFLGYGLPNKWHLYETFKKDSLLSPYILQTSKVTSPQFIIDYLKKNEKILCKPESGAQGKGIFVLLMNEEKIVLRLPKKDTVVTREFSSEEECNKWLERVLSLASYLVQPFVNLTDDKDHPYDLRIFLQKDIRGNWQERGRAIRSGAKGNILSNLHRGGEIIPYGQWLGEIPIKKRAFLHKEIDMLIKHAINVLDANFSPLFEIGLDIGVAKNYSIWLLDTNSKPGRQIILHQDQEDNKKLFEAPFHYCNYLLQSSSTKGS